MKSPTSAAQNTLARCRHGALVKGRILVCQACVELTLVTRTAEIFEEAAKLAYATEFPEDDRRAIAAKLRAEAKKWRALAATRGEAK